MKYPKISIITPSYNQGQFIEQTIRSVVEQAYPNLEYIIIDGGSTDDTVDIIKKYEKHITYWVSEKDKGQSDAINKGMQHVNGEIVNWLNSDDYYMPGVLFHVAEQFTNPTITAYGGRSRIFSKNHEYTSQGTDIYGKNLEKTIGWARIDQPETFFRKSVWDKIGLLNPSFHYIMDREWWVRYLLHYGLDSIVKDNTVLVNFRIHDASKTGSQQSRFLQENIDLFYTLSRAFGLEAKAQFLKSCLSAKLKDLNNYHYKFEAGKKEKIINYFLFKLYCEAYSGNNISFMRESENLLELDLLSRKDQALFQKITFRSKYVPVSVKTFLKRVVFRLRK